MNTFPVKIVNIPWEKSNQDIFNFFDAPSSDVLKKTDVVDNESCRTAVFYLATAEYASEFINMPVTKMDGNSIIVSPEFFDEMSITLNSSWLKHIESLDKTIRIVMKELADKLEVHFLEINGEIKLYGKTWRIQRIREILEEKFSTFVKEEISEERNAQAEGSSCSPESRTKHSKSQKTADISTEEKPKRQRKLKEVGDSRTADAGTLSSEEKEGTGDGIRRPENDSTEQYSGALSSTSSTDSKPKQGTAPRKRQLASKPCDDHKLSDSVDGASKTSTSDTTYFSTQYSDFVVVDEDFHQFLVEHSNLLNFVDCSVTQILLPSQQYKYVFGTNNSNDLKATTEHLKKLLSKVEKKVCHIPDEVDFEVFKSLVENDNRNENITLSFNRIYRTCAVVGTGKLRPTHEWVLDLISKSSKDPKMKSPKASSSNFFTRQNSKDRDQTSSSPSLQPQGYASQGYRANFHPDSSAKSGKLSVLHSMKDEISFTTSSSLLVKVYFGNMVQQRTEAIVNPANVFLNHGGGLARVIASAGGTAIDTECQRILSTKADKKLRTGEVVYTSAGNLPHPIRYVVHAVGPTESEFKGDKSGLISMLEKTFLNCLTCANDQLQVSSISLPPISAGIFAVPMDYIVKGAIKAIKELDHQIDRSSSLKEIHFISNDLKTTEDMVEKFFSCVNKS